jgi:predicted ATP-binding protein involved in virulence
MKMRHLRTRNFRGFEDRSFDFSNQFNVLIGDNGTGKTTVLEAIRILVSALIPRLVPTPNKGYQDYRISDNDVRKIGQIASQKPSIRWQLPVEISCQCEFLDQVVDWTVYLRQEAGAYARGIRSEPVNNILDFANDELRRVIDDDENVVIPLLAYYGTGRLWSVNRRDEQESVNITSTKKRIDGYIDCLAPRSSLILDHFELADEPTLKNEEFEAVKSSIGIAGIDVWESLNYHDYPLDDLIVQSVDKNILPFERLSDGIRNMLGIVSDIAYRAVVLNPQLGRQAASETPGIVLIDEIDLHLHPKWQRRVVDDLRRTFPNIQFFATTHSEHIIQSLREGELIDLNSEDNVPSAEYEGKSLEDISEHVMGVDLPQQSERWKRMMEVAEEYYRILQDAQNVDSNRVNELKIKLDELTLPFSDDPAYQAFLKLEREAAGLGNQV